MTSPSLYRKLCIVVGTRPNFIKVTRFRDLAAAFDIQVQLVHTGQHYDDKMARVFFEQFGLHPDLNLQIASGTPGVQTGHTITALSEMLEHQKPAMVMVVGDVNSTLAGAIAANKCNIPLAHLESGLRSFDLSMPEEHNRRVADALSALHFITEDSGLQNLRREGSPEAGLCFVGNTMIDTLVYYAAQIDASQVLNQLNAEAGSYALVTMHRPSNVDSRPGLELVCDVLEALSQKLKVVFPLHPRSRKNLLQFGMLHKLESLPGVLLTEPQPYFDFQKLIAGSAFVLTDSGGIQEETTFLRKPCLTLRPGTERPCTIDAGTNTLLHFRKESILTQADEIMDGRYKKGTVPPLWDGAATGRVLQRIATYFEQGY